MACTLASSVRGLSASTRTSRPAQRAQRLVVRAANRQSVQDAVMKGAALAGLSAALLNAGSAQAAMEVANIAAGDNRFGTIATLAVPVVGWVGFNILGPLQNQLNDMAPVQKVGRKRSVAAGLGLGAASLLSAQSAEAAQQVADVAASDNRFGIIALLAVPVVGWVGFNILGPLQNQLNEMGGKPSGGRAPVKKRK